MQYRKRKGDQTVVSFWSGDLCGAQSTNYPYDPTLDRAPFGDLTFRYDDGREVIHRGIIGKGNYGFDSYGVTVTGDGKFFVLPTWENGLLAYSMQSGEVVWQTRIRHTRGILAYGETLLLIAEDKKLLRLSAKDGSLLGSLLTAPGCCTLYDVTPRYCAVILPRKKWGIVDKETLEVIQQIDGKDAPEKQPGGELDLMVLDGAYYLTTQWIGEDGERHYTSGRFSASPDERVQKDADPTQNARRLALLNELYGVKLPERALGEHHDTCLFRKYRLVGDVGAGMPEQKQVVYAIKEAGWRWRSANFLDTSNRRKLLPYPTIPAEPKACFELTGISWQAEYSAFDRIEWRDGVFTVQITGEDPEPILRRVTEILALGQDLAWEAEDWKAIFHAPRETERIRIC